MNSLRSHGPIVALDIPSAEKRFDGGKYYVYEILITFEDEHQIRIWRRYSQFDALRDTLQSKMEEGALPKLTRKLYLKRSAVHDVAISRQPKLKKFLQQVINTSDEVVVAILSYFITPTAADEKRANTAEPDGIIRFDGAQVHRKIKAGELEETLGICMVRAVKDAETSSEHELEFKQGDIFKVTGKFTDGWFECVFDGKTGIVNPDFVEELGVEELEKHLESEEKIQQERNKSEQSARPKSILEELITTEQEYVQKLKDVRDQFFPSLRAQVSAPEAKRFFNNWAELIPIHEAFANELSSASNLDATLARYIRGMIQAYSRYCAGIPAAQELYQQKLQEKDFVRFEATFAPLNKPTLNHFMRPFQRVLKYPLLVRELMKEGMDVQNAVDAASDLAVAANANMNAPSQSLEKTDIAHTVAAVDNTIYAAIETTTVLSPPLVLSMPLPSPQRFAILSNEGEEGAESDTDVDAPLSRKKTRRNKFTSLKSMLSPQTSTSKVGKAPLNVDSEETQHLSMEETQHHHPRGPLPLPPSALHKPPPPPIPTTSSALSFGEEYGAALYEVVDQPIQQRLVLRPQTNNTMNNQITATNNNTHNINNPKSPRKAMELPVWARTASRGEGNGYKSGDDLYEEVELGLEKVKERNLEFINGINHPSLSPKPPPPAHRPPIPRISSPSSSSTTKHTDEVDNRKDESDGVPSLFKPPPPAYEPPPRSTSDAATSAQTKHVPHPPPHSPQIMPVVTLLSTHAKPPPPSKPPPPLSVKKGAQEKNKIDNHATSTASKQNQPPPPPPSQGQKPKNSLTGGDDLSSRKQTVSKMLPASPPPIRKNKPSLPSHKPHLVKQKSKNNLNDSSATTAYSTTTPKVAISYSKKPTLQSKPPIVMKPSLEKQGSTSQLLIKEPQETPPPRMSKPLPPTKPTSFQVSNTNPPLPKIPQHKPTPPKKPLLPSKPVSLQ
eukprot:m.34337 g.34337  ORF g.34337 m.34337 type:complete len:953 (-) comp6523_c0_seq1:134-2992(-)